MSRPASSSCDAVSCGVSMPTSTTGSGQVAAQSANASASRGAEISAVLGDDVEPRRHPGPGVAVEDEDVARRRGGPDDVERVAERGEGEVGRFLG